MRHKLLGTLIVLFHNCFSSKHFLEPVCYLILASIAYILYLYSTGLITDISCDEKKQKQRKVNDSKLYIYTYIHIYQSEILDKIL